MSLVREQQILAVQRDVDAKLLKLDALSHAIKIFPDLAHNWKLSTAKFSMVQCEDYQSSEKAYYCSKIANPLVHAVEFTCTPPTIQAWPFFKFDALRIYSRQPVFDIATKNTETEMLILPGWERKMADMAISEDVMHLVFQYLLKNNASI